MTIEQIIEAIKRIDAQITKLDPKGSEYANLSRNRAWLVNKAFEMGCLTKLMSEVELEAPSV